MEKKEKLEKRVWRNYHGDPFSYFKAHPKEFLGYACRYDFSKAHPGMYRALLRAEQIDKAFPKTNKKSVEAGKKGGKSKSFLSEEAQIIVAYETYDGNAYEASKHLPCSCATTIKYWRNAGLEIQTRGRPKN